MTAAVAPRVLLSIPVSAILTRAMKIGLIGGALVVYLATIGIVERFEPRTVVGGLPEPLERISLGLLAPMIVVLITSFIAARANKPGRQPVPATQSIAAGVLAGTISGLVFGIYVVFVGNVDVRSIFANISPTLVEILTFETDPAIAAAGYIIGGAVAGLLAAIAFVAPRRIVHPIVIGLVAIVVMSLLEPLLRVALQNLANQLDQDIFDDIAAFIYTRGGLTVEAAAITFVVAVGVDALRMAQGPAISAAYVELPKTPKRVLQTVGLILATVALILVPHILGPFLSEVIGTVGLYVLMGLGLNIVVGYAGLLDLGYVAFFATGAYVTALLTSPASVLANGDVPLLSFWMSLPIVMVVAAGFGILIGAPVLRLRGDYLAIVTLGFGEIVRILLLSDALRPWFGGAQGILAIPAPEPLVEFTFIGFDFAFGGRDPQSLYYPILAFCLLGAFVAWSLARSRVGRAWNAMREDEEVAQATGINTTRFKLLAFASGAVFGCVAGAFLAVKLGSVFPHRLDILVSISVLSLIILGGMGSIPGVIVGAFVLIGLPELLREFAEYRLLIYGAVLVGMMILRPEGLIPNKARRRELREEVVHEIVVPTVQTSSEVTPSDRGGLR
jgi:branched-chain amino acid transport system permease protein